jgi:uncharacterized protein YbbC (DUF1343 family)
MVWPNYGDIHNAWAQLPPFSENEFIELAYPVQVYVTSINIYETYHAGAVIRIKIKDLNRNEWISVWQSRTGAQVHEQSRIFSPELLSTNFKTNQIRLELDCTVANSYCEIDAVG